MKIKVTLTADVYGFSKDTDPDVIAKEIEKDFDLLGNIEVEEVIIGG